MAKCKDCLYYEACSGYLPTDLDKDVWHLCAQGKADEIPDIDERCSEFKDRTKYVEVVRCKDCKHLGFKGLCYGVCNKKMVGIVKPDDYCSYGERREGE